MASKTKKGKQSKDVSERLKLLRETMGWSQSELARQFGVSAAAVNRWESSEIAMSGTALKLLEIYERKATKFKED